MKTKTDIHKTVRFEPNKADRIDGVRIEAFRWRNSHGAAVIGLDLQEKRVLEISGDGSMFGADYEQVAISIARLLEEAAQDRCLLPKVDDTPKEE